MKKTNSPAPRPRRRVHPRTYYGPTGTPEYPYHDREIEQEFRELELRERAAKFHVVRQIFSILWSTFAALLLIAILTATIVGTWLVVYVMGFRDQVSNVTIEAMEMSYNTNIYAMNEDGEWEQIYEVTSEAQRIPISLDEIPQHTRDAFTCAEDLRFYSHEGVDYKRTFSSFVNMFVHIYDTNQGGSTITQQLIKNLTGDDEQSPSRKIREIFRAMELEKNYSKDKILETYLNYIGFGGPTNGIEAAAEKYFGKSASQLDIAESACLAAIPKSPETLNPFAGYTDETTGEWVNTGRERNRERMEYVLQQMYESGVLTYDQYEEALHEKLIFTDSEEYKAAHPVDEEEQEKESAATTWVIDAAIYELADYIADQFNLTQEQAISRVNSGGYQIYTTIDMNMQEYVEQKYLDISNITDSSAVTRQYDSDGDGEEDTEISLESAFIAMNYQGEILALVGSVGEKTESLNWNYATMEPRQPGSTIKPLTTYGLALESDLIHWGSIYEDAPIQVNGEAWPTNYSEDSDAMHISHQKLHIYKALEKSYNTVPAQLCEALTPRRVFDFATEKMHLDLTESDGEGHTDIDYSPLTVGALTYGVTLENLVNAYIPYGNGGTHYDAHIISRVVQGADTVVFEKDGDPERAVSEDTAYVMNKLLQNVVQNGTGTRAQLSKKHVAGKTGTTQNWNDLTFVGLTEDFVSGVWLGYPERVEIEDHSIKSAQLWRNVIGAYANEYESDAAYPENSDVIEAPMCEVSGCIAGEYCESTVTGYWKPSNAPVCTTCRYVPPVTTTATQQTLQTTTTAVSTVDVNAALGITTTAIDVNAAVGIETTAAAQ